MPSARAAVPQLLMALKDPQSSVRINAVAALGECGAGAAEVVSGLREALFDPYPIVGPAAARALRRLGPSAKDAIPDLDAARKGTNPILVPQAAMAIGQIDPGRVKTTTIPALLEVISNRPASVATVNALKSLAQLGPDAAPASRRCRS